MKISPAGLLVLAALSPAVHAQDPPDDDLYYEVEKLGWDLTHETNTAGVAITRVQGGKIAWSLGCGYADVESETPVTGETVFNIGSISKSVAAWGVMKLVEEGKLDLDAPVERKLTRWKLPESEFDSSAVTLRRLLSHTAGLSLHGYPGFEPGERLPTIEESLDGATNGPGGVYLVHAPGTKWQYSGGGYTIAQLLVEEVTGRAFADYMRAEVLLPLGMESSDYGWTEKIDRLAATPYDEEGKPIGGPRFTALAAAGLQTTSEDLARFAIANMPAFAGSGKPVLHAETIALMHTPAEASPSYGLGFQVSSEGPGGLRILGHGGSNQGWMAQLSFVPELGDAIVILTNSTNGRALHRPIADAWKRALPLPKEAKPVSADADPGDR